MNFFAAPDVTDGLTLALTPPPEVANQMALAAEQLRATHGAPFRPRAPEQLNLVLQSLGDHAGLRRDIVSMAAEAAASVEPPGPLDLCFDRAQSRMNTPGRFDLILRSSAPSAPLEAFQKDLGLAMARAGLGRLVDRVFEPHVLMIENARADLDLPIKPISWTVTSFQLLHVLLGRQVHVPLARWPLTGATRDARDQT